MHLSLLQQFLEGISNSTSIIVHYLGLDHIGHALEAFNNLIQDKLNEYDKIIEYIYSKLNDNDILIMTGDQGGYGGASNVEISVPVSFISKHFENISKINEEYLQIDLTPTLSALLEIGIPSNNLGILIENILKNFYNKIN